MRITKQSIIFPLIDNQILKDAFYKAYLYEREKSHLYDANEFLQVYDQICEGVNANDKKFKS